MLKKEEKLVIGSAGKNLPDVTTLDIEPEHNPDVLHDLHHVPWPFKDDQFKEITCHHVLEHLNDISDAKKELHRICHPQGTISIEVPHHSSWCAHSPYHKLFFSAFAFDGWCEGNYSWQRGAKFKMIKREISFHRAYRRYFLHKIFNRHLMAYERFWTYIFPAEHLKVVLQPIK
ncbi:MAG: methyltransferase domain-containing protein [Candidatus Omnitrophica bacterium]|nr:methyltransferase domain-containing protein [Candidatus Omnitrophota bacterium]